MMKNKIWWKYWMIGLLVAYSQSVWGQQFKVQNFRPLPNDISAYIHLVRDLNQDACALIKVVGDVDYAFSTPLGIVKRIDDIGEIWIYVPHGTLQLTIKHPQWGVFRDYRFPMPLESRMTYELVLADPLVVTSPWSLPMKERRPVLREPFHSFKELSESAQVKLERPREPWHYWLMANIGMYEEGVNGGIRIGMMKRHGFYLAARTDFHSLPETFGECSRNGEILGTGNIPYYIEGAKQGCSQIFVGGLHRLYRGVSLYEGIGYGEYSVIWETSEGRYLRNSALSSKGVAGELGFLCSLRGLAFSFGVSTIEMAHWEVVAGIGFYFK